MTHKLIKQHWLELAVEIRSFHIQQLKDERAWTLEKTAKTLNRSIGSISQYILIAEWCKTHEKQLKRCDSARDALAFIKLKKREMELE